MSFIKRVENQNEIKVKQLRTDNGTEFRNSILVNFCDEKGISQKISSPYTPEQNGVAERKNRTLIEAARTMLLGSVFSTPLPLLKKLDGVEPVSGPKTIKSILKLKSTFKAETLKGIIINEPSSALARGNKSSSASKTNSALAGKLKNVKMEDDPPLAIVMKEHNELKLQISKNNYDHDTHGHNKIISLRRGIKPRNPQHVTKNCETCSSNVYATSVHNDIEWFRKREALQAKKAESFKIEQSKRGISIKKERYVKDLLRKYDKIGSSVNTLIVPPNMLGPDLNGKVVNESQYRDMIGSLTKLTARRPDIQFSTCLYARH
ncbi:retrovirus-related pol polyprotein from transposon TNT 1-94 [Tanacetum coccineum]